MSYLYIRDERNFLNVADLPTIHFISGSLTRGHLFWISPRFLMLPVTPLEGLEQPDKGIMDSGEVTQSFISPSRGIEQEWGQIGV